MLPKNRQRDRQIDGDALPELTLLERLIDSLGEAARVSLLAREESEGLPIYGLTLGSRDPSAPAILFVGGVHGVERIGAEVVIAFLHQIVERLSWDEGLQHELERYRLAFLPIVNPGGMKRRVRANPAGVDLMRNAPSHPEAHPAPLLGGQRLSSRLPWYAGEGFCQPESRALRTFVEETLYASRCAISLDCHSGFGMVDRLWFPYARTRRPFHHLPEMYRLEELLDRTLPNHIYRVEQVAQSYTIDGDLWDHLYDARRELRGDESVFLPLTLEMGSWAWVRKNPRQLFEPLGAFNPLVRHRLQRTLRRHLLLFDFLTRVIMSERALSFSTLSDRLDYESSGYRHYFGR